jgi:Xaa-Pro aminopeptidase
MIVSNEPGYYRDGGYGIRIENLELVTPAAMVEGGERPMLGFEALTLAPIDRRLVVVEMLSAEERAWLNAYHARVLREIGPLVDEETRAWLERATAPL